MENENTNVETNETNKDTNIESVMAELNKLKEENEKLRKANTNASADASKYKKELQAKMSEQEKAEALRKESEDAMKQELEALRREKTISEYTSQFLGVGFEGDLAKITAEAMAGNDYKTFFESLSSFVEAHDRAKLAEAIKGSPKIGAVASGNNQQISAEQFNKMGYAERNKLFNENPQLYDELKKGE